MAHAEISEDEAKNDVASYFLFNVLECFQKTLSKFQYVTAKLIPTQIEAAYRYSFFLHLIYTNPEMECFSLGQIFQAADEFIL